MDSAQEPPRSLLIRVTQSPNCLQRLLATMKNLAPFKRPSGNGLDSAARALVRAHGSCKFTLPGGGLTHECFTAFGKEPLSVQIVYYFNALWVHGFMTSLAYWLQRQIARG